MDALVSTKFIVAAIYLAGILYVHWRGAVRLPLLRQVFNHSSLLAPVNAPLYLFSAVPARPFLDRSQFPELDLLQRHWQEIRDEAIALRANGLLQAAQRNDDASFNSFFKEGWRRFYLRWYGRPLPSASALCPRTLALLAQLPRVRAAMFALLPAGAHLNPHRDPFAGSLRYHLGLVTPNDDGCRIVVDGQGYSWRDGQDVLFDETFVHHAHNMTAHDRLILFCDIERPLHPSWLMPLNRALGTVLGGATAAANCAGDSVGIVNRLYTGVHWLKQGAHRLKRRNRSLYKVLKVGLIAGLLYVIFA